MWREKGGTGVSVIKSKRSQSSAQFLETAQQIQIYTLRQCVKFPKRYTILLIRVELVAPLSQCVELDQLHEREQQRQRQQQQREQHEWRGLRILHKIRQSNPDRGEISIVQKENETFPNG